MNQIITPEMQEIKNLILQTVMQRSALKIEMQDWYEKHPRDNFPKMTNLILVDSTLSKLDSSYKNLWDYNNARSS